MVNRLSHRRSTAPRRWVLAASVVLIVFVVALVRTAQDGREQWSARLRNPDHPQMNQRAPERFAVHLSTNKGLIVIDVTRAWSPRGVDRFCNLVAAGYYNEVRFHRVVPGRWAQFGINGDPAIATAWRERTIPDDPRVESNVKGTIAFAYAVPNGRTTQVFFNLSDNRETHDKEPFVPFGRISSGLEVMDALNGEYGESSGGGIRAGKQAPLFAEGNAYLHRLFPRLDYIRHAHIQALPAR